MNDLKKTIKHFESLQKRYTTQHNGQMCERVADALEALNCFAVREVENEFKKLEVLEKQRDVFSRIVDGLMNNTDPTKEKTNGEGARICT